MRPQRDQDQPQRELYPMELDQMIDLHPLVRLGTRIDWALFHRCARLRRCAHRAASSKS
jgi:hypothetical protein